MKKFKNYVKRIIKLINVEEMRILPGHLAFYIVLMIVPIFSIIGALGSNFGVERIVNSLADNIPDAVLSIIDSALNASANGYNLFFFIIFSLWMVSGGCRAIIVSSDVLYKIKDSSGLKIVIKSFIMVLVLFLLIGFVIVVPILGDFIINLLNNYLQEGGMIVVTKIYHFIKYPITIFMMFILIKFLYAMAPSIHINSKYMNNGAWFTTISWFILTRIYSYHLNNYSNYNLYYGSLSNILILLVWVYFLAYLFMVGLSLNADNYFTATKQEKKELEE